MTSLLKMPKVISLNSGLTNTPAHPHISNRKIAIASIIWASSIFLSRIMGLLREQIIGRTLGATRQADLYFASFTLPDFLTYLLACRSIVNRLYSDLR